MLEYGQEIHTLVLGLKWTTEIFRKKKHQISYVMEAHYVIKCVHSSKMKLHYIIGQLLDN